MLHKPRLCLHAIKDSSNPRNFCNLIMELPLNCKDRSVLVASDRVPFDSSSCHYDDDLVEARWTAKECHNYFQDRPWAAVLQFYSLVAKRELSLSELIIRQQPKYAGFEPRGSNKEGIPIFSNAPLMANILRDAKGGKWERKTYKMTICYDGSAFEGWQKQPGLLTVQGVIEKTLGRFVDGKRAKSFEAQGLPIEATVSVAGRTDKGVHAAGQVCSFYTWMKDIKLEEIEAAINVSALEALRVISVEEVPRTFHPNFSACWRRYVYLLPLNNYEVEGIDSNREETCTSGKPPYLFPKQRFDVMAVNRLLCELEGRSLTYTAFARDTATSRSKGDPTVCVIHHARAGIAEIPVTEQVPMVDGRKTLCIELVANRFLRKMVRVLVATVIREAVAGEPLCSLIELANTACRRASAPPAPPCGLCLAEVGYGDISNKNFLIT